MKCLQSDYQQFGFIFSLFRNTATATSETTTSGKTYELWCDRGGGVQICSAHRHNRNNYGKDGFSHGIDVLQPWTAKYQIET
ncbi:hypothetical protein TSUD_24050 [Trifolium subterraneum]|uniref:Uncharacterized protein n=1 Tax=Trifolium subterraneum TaxID=3900 RepID=A0A2Z6NIN2_TRISU|nr:hypothetical protein TSUD_24050 [Trifolium subterraneum]